MDSKSKWNQKYKQHLTSGKDQKPNPRLEQLSNYLTGGQAIDLACGLGANSLLLAERKYHVKAYDISEVAINYLKQQINEGDFHIEPIVCDLTDVRNMKLKSASCDLVVISYYLDRSLFPIVKSIIKDNGYFFMETFYSTLEQHPRHIPAQYKLGSNELLQVFNNWKILYYEESEHEGRQTIFCQKA
ncbi:class I SAM-dependent methyltransferase [Desertibacillus haloalkaliphilus]|uniref:class I SAM-dependent methyltransferase n=1 Tax=Desertibacillus haloalkaliphilus TaxID=1328930 RepID=UPI001C252513|nr:methyltransferase domain-containing protein [Desertibacillus haloalkaliphilus]MBU8907888.1 methyltransferase domain-containing protein [Desertibacillus haloalkaliphilus]